MKTYINISKGQILSIVGLIAVTFIEAFATMEMATGVLYLCSIFFVLREKKHIIIAFAVATLCLIYVNFLIFFKPSNILSIALVNRVISMAAIAVTTYMALIYRKLEESRRRQNEEYIKSMEQMLYITSHKVRSPACSILGLLEIADISSPEEQAMLWDFIRNAATEMDAFTRELNDFVYHMEQEHRKESIEAPLSF